MQGPSGPRRGIGLRNLSLIEDGAVLVVDGIVSEVGVSRRLENLAASRGADVFDATGCVVLPGLVDCRALPFGRPAPFTPGTLDRTTGQLRTALRRFLLDCVRHGTTTVMAGLPESGNESTDRKALRVLTAMENAPIRTVTGWLPSPDWLERSAEPLHGLLPGLRKLHSARVLDLPLPTGEVSDEANQSLQATLQAAARLGFTIRAVAGPCANRWVREPQAGLWAVSGDSTGSAAELTGLVSLPNVITLLEPTAALLRREPSLPFRALADRGAAIALSSGFDPHHARSLSLPAAIALACVKGHLTPAEAIVAATINSAHALGLAGQIGSIEHGRQADLLVLNTGDYRDLSTHLGTDLVRAVICRGRPVYHQAEVPWPDS